MLSALDKFAKPADLGFISNAIAEVSETQSVVMKKDMKAPPSHMHTMIDGLNLFMWPLMAPGDELQDYLKQTNDEINFYGNKVLKLDKEKDTTWYNAYRSVVEAYLAFFAGADVRWTGKETSGVEAFAKGGAVQSSQPAKQEAPTQQV